MTKEIKTDELEQVNGGTLNELAQLMKADSGSDIIGSTGYLAGFNTRAAKIMENRLESLGIEADIDIGIAGLGLNEKPNKYTDMATGESLSHLAAVSVLQANS